MIGREIRPVGLEAVAALTSVLQRCRRAHPTASVFEAADIQFWWRNPRPTDTFEQLVWLDANDDPIAAVAISQGPTSTMVLPILLPDASPDEVEFVVSRGVEHAEAAGFAALVTELDPADAVMVTAFEAHGFASTGPAVIEGWLDIGDRPAVSGLASGYALTTRAAVRSLAVVPAHHMTRGERSHADVESRLRQISLYRDDLDLVVRDPDGDVAAYGLFWIDAATATGLVEPMRTEEAHQRRGLARHVLTSGLEFLAREGAERVKICWDPENEIAGALYRSVGFVPVRESVGFAQGVAESAA